MAHGNGVIELTCDADALVAGEFVRRAVSLHGIATTPAWRSGVVASELARNAIEHGGGGSLLLLLAETTAVICVTNATPGRVARVRQCAAAPDGSHGLATVQRFAEQLAVRETDDGRAELQAVMRLREPRR